jgi:hypothetical protein
MFGEEEGVDRAVGGCEIVVLEARLDSIRPHSRIFVPQFKGKRETGL